jgi:hypothetical protein
MDKELTCLCGKIFIFEAGEQAFFLKKGYTPPKRCQECRDKAKAARGEEPTRRVVIKDYGWDGE